MLLALVATAHVSAADNAAGYHRDIQPLLKKYCYDCHGAHLEKPKGKLNLEQYADERAILADRKTWKGVLDALEFREMPPKDDPQPDGHERGILMRWIGKTLDTPDLGGQRDPGRPMLRRLTRLEYNNTVRDLLRLDTDVFGFPERLPNTKDHFARAAQQGDMPDELRVQWREYGAKIPALLRQAGLPGDNRAEHGFTNRGDALNFSPVLLEKYLAVADDILTAPKLLDESPVMREMFPGVIPPKPAVPQRPVVVAEGQKFNPGVAMPKPKGPSVDAVGVFAANDNVVSVAPDSSSTPNGFTDAVATAFAENRGGVFDARNNEIDGNVIKAGEQGGVLIPFGADRKHQLAMISSADLWIVGFGTAEESSGEVLITNRVKNAKVFDLHFDVFRDDKELGIAELGVVVLSRNKQSGPVTLTVTHSDGTTASLSKQMQPDAGKDNTLFSFAAPYGHVIRQLHVDGRGFSGEFVLLDDIGFIVREYDRDDNPVTVAGDEPKQDDAPKQAEAKKVEPEAAPKPPAAEFDDAAVRDRLASFMKRAFRRPVSSEEVELYFGVYKAGSSAGRTDAQALRQAIRAVLASPHFLYLVEPVLPEQVPVRELNDHELANRLSYFLWASMPDDELTKLADEGKLRDPDVLETQAMRMLKDPKAKELSESFAFQWLRLNELLGAQPDKKLYRSYYGGPQGKGTLTAHLMVEAQLIFETVMVEDRSIIDLIDADWAYLNNRLIDHYGYSEQLGDLLKKAEQDKRGADSYWYRVSLPDRRRGGVFTSGAVLTLTSLPYRSSPIKRGAWMLESIFNRPPPPPIANAGEIPEGDEDGKLSLREKVSRHRADPACAACHDRIDPLGFALENYDGIGQWRTADGDLAIDPSGQLPDGRAFTSPVEFKDALLKRKEEFARAFTEHMLSYALARKLEYYDTTIVKQIVEAAAADDYRFSTIVTEIVRSYPFRNIRNIDAAEKAAASNSE